MYNRVPRIQPGRTPIETKTDLPSHWSSFWQQGFITTFGSSKPNNYDGVVRNFWREKFIALPDGAQILDIATGNGAIATLAAEVGKEKSKTFTIAATDLAEVKIQLDGQEAANTLRESIEFHSHTPCEKQPFDDDQFDLVTSQFGFEYSDIKRSLAEVRRLLKADGRFVAISHHLDSDLIKAAIGEIEIYKRAMDDLDLFGGLRSYTAAMGELSGEQRAIAEKINRATPLAVELMTKVKAFQKQFADAELCRELIEAISSMAKPQHASCANRLAFVEAAETNFSLARARLQDMASAAISQTDIELLSVMAKEAGFSPVHCLKLYGDDQGLAGWQIHLGPAL